MINAQDVKQIDSVEVLIIDTLSIGSSYEIIRHSQGCFHNYRDTLKISRKNDGLYVSMKGNEIKLETKLLEKYKIFERELLYEFHLGGCTTVDEYILKTKSFEVLLLNDDSCKWNGFDNFITQEE
jgi:hypothetical protein